jgi:hypothetical protein
LTVKEGTVLDVGLRDRLAIGGGPASRRAQILNVTDTRQFLVSSSNAFTRA